MRRRAAAIWPVLALLLPPQVAFAKHHHATKPEPPVEYGIGLICPTYEGDRLSLYSSYGDNQISSNTIVFKGTGYSLTSQIYDTLKDAGVQVFEGYCDKHWPALRIDARNDRWVQLGNLWAPTGQDWNYLQWADILQKAPVLHALGALTIYDGSEDDVLPESFNEDAPHGTLGKKSDLRPIRFQDNYVMVEVGRAGKFGDGCTPPLATSPVTTAVTGWVKFIDDDGKPLLVPRKAPGC